MIYLQVPPNILWVRHKLAKELPNLGVLEEEQRRGGRFAHGELAAVARVVHTHAQPVQLNGRGRQDPRETKQICTY